MDLTYMEYLLSIRKINLPRVIIRHMAYVINVPNHELPYGELLTRIFEAFHVPLNYKKGEDPKRRDDEIDAPATNEEEAVNDEDEIQGEEVEKETEIQEGSGSDDKFYDVQVEVEAPADEVPAASEFPASPADSTTVQKEKAPAGVDPSALTGSIPDSVFVSLQADFERAQANRIQAELERAQANNTRLLALLPQAKAQPKP
ncbi:hypothetical protein Dimus_022668 [Dionaea muscipula]